VSDSVGGDPVDVDAARARAAAATPGPWEVEITGGVDVTGEGWTNIEIQFNDPLETNAGLMMGEHECAEADAVFIAAARSDVPALADEVERLRAQVELANSTLMAERDAALAEVTRLRAALLEAADDVQSWGAYAGEYFQEKWDLAGDIARIRAALGGGSDD
jgi:hypothetical protein